MCRPCYQRWLGRPENGHGCPGRHYGYPGSGHGCSGGMELVLGLHQKCSGVVKLVIELHHGSQRSKQGEFWDGGASMWASPCEFRW